MGRANRKTGSARNRESEKGLSLNAQLTPMIDVVFLLLSFFLVATKIQLPERKLDAFLPLEGGPPKKITVQDQQQLKILVEGRGDRLFAYYVGTLDPEVISRDPIPHYGTVFELTRALRRLYALDEKFPVVIAGSRKIHFKYVTQALNAARKVGFKDVSFGLPPKPLREKPD